MMAHLDGVTTPSPYRHAALVILKGLTKAQEMSYQGEWSFVKTAVSTRLSNIKTYYGNEMCSV